MDYGVIKQNNINRYRLKASMETIEGILRIIGGHMEYKNLESRMVNAYLLQSAPIFEPDTNCSVSESEQKELYEWTRQVYAEIVQAPELLVKVIHEDDAHPNRFNKVSYGKPQLISDMRKVNKAMNELMQGIWNMVIACKIVSNEFRLPDDYIVPKKYSNHLEKLGIHIEQNVIHTTRPILSAIKNLAKYENGFERFIRCSYQEDMSVFIDTFRPFAINEKAYDRLIQWLQSNGFQYQARLNGGEVKNLEASQILFMKNIHGQEVDFKSMYDHDHIGLFVHFTAVIKEPTAFLLLAQDVRETLNAFDSLKPELKRFIIYYHARCNGCGYCTQRNRGKTPNIKPYTIIVEYEGSKHALCPINYVYTYCWNLLNDELVDGIIGYLEYLQERFELKLQ
jgi:hypothetical protein